MSGDRGAAAGAAVPWWAGAQEHDKVTDTVPPKEPSECRAGTAPCRSDAYLFYFFPLNFIGKSLNIYIYIFATGEPGKWPRSHAEAR